MAEAKSKGSGDLGKCPKCSQVAEMIRQRGIGHCFQEEPVPIIAAKGLEAISRFVLGRIAERLCQAPFHFSPSPYKSWMKNVITMLHRMVTNSSPSRSGTKRSNPTQSLLPLATANDIASAPRTAIPNRPHASPCGNAEG